MDYILIRSKRKTISLTINNNLEVEVRAPRFYPKADIDEFVEKHSDWVEKHIAIKKRYIAEFDNLSPDRVVCLKAMAKSVLPERVEYFGNIMGLHPTGVKITSAKKRFGSCSGTDSICFSYHLMQYSPEAVDYVVVHELAHIKHKNHSKAFYSLVEQYLPDYRQREKMLRK